MSGKTVAICGIGASAALLLCALTRLPGKISVVVIGNRAELGEGIAYATTNPHHLLNAPAARMSAAPSDPQHFLDWLTDHGINGESFANQFVLRTHYARYLAQVTTTTLHAALHCGIPETGSNMSSRSEKT